MDYSYKLQTSKNSVAFKYFTNHPISEWSFSDFERSINKDLPKPPNVAKTKKTYLSNLKNIQKLKNIPDFVKKEIERLLSLTESSEEEPQSINFNITAQKSSVYNASGSGSITFNQQQQLVERAQPQKEDAESNDKEKSDEEESDEENKIPSDLSIDHHPYRTCEYNLKIIDSDDDEEEEDDLTRSANTSNESKWMLNDICISDLCLDFKEASLKLAKNTDPSQLSDMRLLALNDIYKFDRNFSSSISKYFSTQVHTMLKPTLFFDDYLPKKGLNCYDWCMDIEVSPPVDYITSITLCADLLKKACDSKNFLDIHTAQILTQILPVLVNGPPEDSTEDSYVHYYLSPLLSSVFSTDPLLKMKWANGKLMNNQNEYKPDFLLYNTSGNKKCVIIIAEFKPSEKNSYVESDLVKLAKQMKETLNEMIINGVSKPEVCGIHCEGENVYTYIMDLPSPKLYRLVNASKIKLFKSLDQISLLPSVITQLLCLKNVALKTAIKSEAALLYSYRNLKRQAPNPPKDWISSTKAVIHRLSKKQKKINVKFICVLGSLLGFFSHYYYGTDRKILNCIVFINN